MPIRVSIRQSLPIKICYLILGLVSFTLKIVAQHPGGNDVPSPKFWLVSSQQKTLLSNNANSYLKFGNPVAEMQNINFNTALKFTAQAKQIRLSNIKPVSIVTAFYPDPTSVNPPHPDSFYSVLYNNQKLIKLLYNKLLDSNINAIVNKYAILSSQTGTGMKISANYFTSFPAVDMSNPAGVEKETALTMTFNGYCPEMLVYETPLSPMDLWKVQTYFAIKYGITSDASYVGTNGKIIWNDTLRAKFDHRVCAIGKDLRGAINQPVANTSYEDGKYNSYDNGSEGYGRSVTIGFSKNGYPDKSFLLWGDDNGSMSVLDSISIKGADAGGKIEVVKRRWLMQNDSAIGSSTEVELGGALMDNLKKENYCYLLIKKANGSLDSSNVFPLDSSMTNGKFCRKDKNIIWNNAVDTFSFGRAKKLLFTEIQICNYAFCWYDDGDIIGKKKIPLTQLPDPLSKCRFVFGYRYRTINSGDLECALPQELNHTVLTGEVEIYFSGGVGPYSYQIDGKGNFMSLGQTVGYQSTSTNIALIKGLIKGTHKIILSDMTRQKSESLSLVIP